MNTTPSRNLYWDIVIGYTVGMSVFFLPLFLLGPLQSMAAQPDIGTAKAIGIFVLLPVILFFQGIMFSAFVMLGLCLANKARRIIPTSNT